MTLNEHIDGVGGTDGNISPAEWGWKDSLFQAALEASASTGHGCVPGRVIRTERHLYSVVVPRFERAFYGAAGLADLTGHAGSAGGSSKAGMAGDDSDIPCGIFPNARVSGKFEYRATGPEDFPVTGDWVLVEIAGHGGNGSASAGNGTTSVGTPLIQAVLPRFSSVTRTGAGVTSDSQTLAANVDVLFLVFALDGGRNFLERLLERALVVARSGGARPCVVLNKADLASEEDRNSARELARSAAGGIDVLVVSAKTGEGIGELSRIARPGETVGVLGKSGVGKSALVNALERLGCGADPAAGLEKLGSDTVLEAGLAGGDVLCGEAGLAGDVTLNGAFARKGDFALEGAVRADDLRGRHTTTASRLYRLPSGILMIDSPGIRELKIWGTSDAVDETFADIAELASLCRFADCSHETEKGCAVRQALESGELDQARFKAWKNLAREQAYNERRSDEKARREHDQKWKDISKMQKVLKKNR